MRVRDCTLPVLAGLTLWLGPTAASAQPAERELLTLGFLSPTNGLPQASLVAASDGNFYGTGTSGQGAVFQLTPAGALTTLYTFTNSADGAGPQSNLIQATDGNLYGTTSAGGAYYNGTVFKLSLAGAFSVLASFPANPCRIYNSALVQGSDGNFYGTTTGGAGCAGTIYRITPAGALTTLHTFSGPDGALPQAALLQVAGGAFYGTTAQGGADNLGTVFSITASGALSTLFSFDGTNGAWPAAALVLGTDGNLYGTTSGGGADNAGTVFRITPAGVLTTLYSFGGGTDGFAPNGLIQGTDGNFYGTTGGGGPNGCPTAAGPCGGSVGTIFEITPSGTLTTLYGFAVADGQNPAAALVQGSNGDFYGSTSAGGANGFGTVFEFGFGIPFAPVDLAGSSNSSGTVALTWDTGGGGSTYNVYAASSSAWQFTGGFNQQPLATVSGTSASFSNLAPGTTYYFAVAWVNAGGLSGTSGLSNVVTVTTPGTAPPPPYFHGGGGSLGPWLLAVLLLALLWRQVPVPPGRRILHAP
jgi:uncharacterized repeat protein (TIGR03803 family)